MNLSFDLQLFATATSVANGVTFDGSNVYTISNITLGTAFSKTSVIGNLDKVTTIKSGLFGELATTADSNALASFKGKDGEATVASSTLRGSGAYTWELYTDSMDEVYLGQKAKLNVLKANGGKVAVTLDSAAGQSVTFGGSNSEVALEVVDNETSGTATTLGGSVAIKGGKGDFSLLSGSSVSGATATGAAGEVVTLSTGTNDVTFNLKGTDAQAVVTIGGSVSSSEITGFNSIVFDAKTNKNAALVSLASVKNSAVSILGGTVADSVTIGANVNSGSSIVIDGGAGNDSISLSGTGYETIVLGAKHGADSIKGWKDSAGDTTKGNMVSLAGTIDTFAVHTVTGGYADVSVEGDGSAAGATIFGSGTTAQVGVNLITKEDTYSALLVGSEKLNTASTKFDNFNYIIADSKKTLDFGSAKKSVVVLANEVDTKHWGDNNVYQNITTVVSSTAGKSLIINGTETETSLQAAGSNDSLWGGANGVADTLSAAAGKENISIFTGKNDGLDVLEGYTFGATKDKSNVVRFLDGVQHIVAGNKTLTFGADDSNALVVNFSKLTDNQIAYAFGAEGEKYIAGVDTSEKGNGSITYDSDVNVYIGQGDNSKIVVNSGDEVKLGWDGGAGYVSVGGVDATLAKEGSVVVGTTEYGQSIAGSSRGASSISGGFVADKWTDENADTLVGGGVATKSTTFFVGKDMGRDEIIDLSSKDNIVFLGTKYADLVSDLAPDASDNSLTFKFAGNTIEASLQTGKTMKSLTDVSLYFDDGTYVWNGTEFAKAE